MLLRYNNLPLFYRTHSMTLRTAQALYTLASLKLLHTTLMTIHWDSINTTGKVCSFLATVCKVSFSKPAEKVFYHLSLKAAIHLGNMPHSDQRSDCNSILIPTWSETVYIPNSRE